LSAGSRISHRGDDGPFACVWGLECVGWREGGWVGVYRAVGVWCAGLVCRQ
jgi:hypothetical protein